MSASLSHAGKEAGVGLPNWKAVAQNHQRPLALFSEMEMNAICDDGAMRNATYRLRVDRTGLRNSAGRRRADRGNKFASLHR